MTRIDRTKAKETFAAYVDNYNSEDPKIKLKILHTYRVAELCDTIGASEGLSGEALDAAWMCGLLHDIGRFEQIRRYGTFQDAVSIDHALLSTTILFGEASVCEENGSRVFVPQNAKGGSIRSFFAPAEWDAVIGTAIFYHSCYRLPENLDEKTAMYCKILRDADKIDILRVNLDTPMEEIYNVTTEELKNSQVTPEVMQAFDEHHAVLRALKKTAIDNAVGHISLTYELEYPMSRKIMKEQGYLDKLMNFESENPVTREQFLHIREEMNRYLAKDSGEEEHMDFLTANYHTHTYRCLHATGTEREYIEEAIRYGIKKLGFSDHIPCPFKDGYVSKIRMTMEQAKEYYDCIRSLAKEYENQITLYAGFEAEYIPEFYEEQIEMVRSIGFDYLIMGQHFVGNEKEGPYTGTPTEDEKMLIRYVDTVIAGAETGSFTYIAHPDILNYIGEEAIYDREMKRLCTTMKQLGIPLEINILGMTTGRQYPNEHFWKLVAEVGNDVVLGLDAHRREEVGNVENYRKCMDIVDKYGLKLCNDIILRKP